MTTVSQSDFAALESLLGEFYAGTTGNVRKREIETVLMNFGEQKDAWRQCLDFLTMPNSNPFVSMFILTTLESIVRRRWVGMAGEDKSEVRKRLHAFLVSRSGSNPAYVRNKAAKLVVDIAATDWPHFYPDFFEQVLELASRRETLCLALSMLLITSEELATPRDSISSARKEELRKLLASKVPVILSTMCWVLESLLAYFLPGEASRSVATPPPSPSPPSLGDGNDDSSSTDSLTAVGQQLATNRLHSQMPEPSVVEASGLALRCTTHLFTWVPLTTVITSRLLAAIFHFAALGLHSAKSELPQGDCKRVNSDLGVLAMSTINEIIYRHCVPADFEDFLLHMFQNTFQLLQMVVQPLRDGAPCQLHFLDEQYLDKFTEFLGSFVRSHLRRFESNARFPMIGFLSLLYKYTFEHRSHDKYLSCLEVWSVCVDYVSGLVATRSSEAEAILAKYRHPLGSLVDTTLKRLQLRDNADQLEKLDDDSFDDDEETEWQHYLRASIETIMKVTDVLPQDVLNTVDASWKGTMTLFLQLDNCIKGGELVLPTDDDHVQLHRLLRDFASLLQLVGRLSALFIGEKFQDRITPGNEVMKHLIHIAGFSASKKLYAITTTEQLSTDLIEAHAQALAALKAWCHWLSQLHSLALRDPAYEPQCKDLTLRIMVAVAPVIREGSTCQKRRKLVHSAAHFMVTLTGTVRPPSIWKLKEFTDMYSSLGTIKLEPDDHRLTVRALTNVLMLPWPGIQDQRWEERQRHLAKFLKDITETFRCLKSVADFSSRKDLQDQAKPVVIHTLRLISDLSDNVLNEVTQTKKLCYDCAKEYVGCALALFPVYVGDAHVCEEIFAFFHTVLDVLKSQMGAEAIEEAIGTLIGVFNKDQLAHIIVNEGSAGSRVVEKFLTILQLVVKESDVSFRKFIDSALSLCLDYIYPLVAERPVCDIKAPLFSVLGNVLLYNWRHFFKSSVMRSLIGASSPVPSGGQVVHRGQFIAILNAFGQSFMQSDIAVFRQNLAALEKLNEKWNLYHKPIFTESLIAHFLTALLQVLINKSHDLLREEITQAVFNMASVDFASFFATFLAGFLAKQERMDANQKANLKATFKEDTDYPTFTANLGRFVGDLRFYQLCNASLPAGSVCFSA